MFRKKYTYSEIDMKLNFISYIWNDDRIDIIDDNI